jgi:hypothetical protein
MSQRDVETLLGRLLADGIFRHRFLSTPEEILSEEPFQLIPREIQAVLAIDAREIERFACRLDPRIVRADGHPKPRASGETSGAATPKRKLERDRIVG